MSYPIMYEGIVNGATYLLDDATIEAIKGDEKKIERKVVTVTENFKVGFGSAGDNPRGFVLQIEPRKSGSDEICVSVIWNKELEDIPCTGSENVKQWVACDGNGGLQPSTTPTNARIDGIDTTTNTCAVYIHG